MSGLIRREDRERFWQLVAQYDALPEATRERVGFDDFCRVLEDIEERALALDAPAPGTVCPRCGEQLRIVGFCGACAERDDPLRIEEARLIQSLAADDDIHSSDREPLVDTPGGNR